MSTAERAYDHPQDRWQGHGYGRWQFMHPGWIIVMILGFIFWWPVGLAILVTFFRNRGDIAVDDASVMKG